MNNYLIYLKNIITTEEGESMNLSFMAVASHCKSPEEAREVFLKNNDEESLQALINEVQKNPKNALIIVDDTSELARETVPEIVKYLEDSVAEGEVPEELKETLNELKTIKEKIDSLPTEEKKEEK